MNIDQWAATADTTLPASGETLEEYEKRIAELRALSIRNDAAHPWSHHRRQSCPAPVAGPVDLYTASGEFVRHCTGVAQARETVHTLQPGAISMRLSQDRSQVLIRFPGSKKDYTYVLKGA